MYRGLITFLSVGAVAIRLGFAGPVDGHAYLQGESSHSGITVVATKNVWPPVSYTTSTTSSGYYEFSWILTGWYDFEFSHAGFITQTVRSIWVPPVLRKTLPSVTLPRDDTGCGGEWRHYPYEPPGTEIRFPADEGRHDPMSLYPVEWWYANFHLTGSDPDHEYGAFVAFFKITPGSGMRLFAISDLSQAQVYSRRRIGAMQEATSHLDLTFCHIGQIQQSEPQEESDVDGQISDGDSHIREESGGRAVAAPDHSEGTVIRPTELTVCDRWYNKEYDGDLLPFEYRLRVRDSAIQDFNTMLLDVDMYSLKPPMIEGGDGVDTMGLGAWSYYYSHTRVDVRGTIQVHGRSEPVTGYAWIDHQWGNLCLDCSATWEWFSIQLDDGREIMVADVWDGIGVQQPCYEGLNFYDENCSLELLPGYNIQRTEYCDDPSGRTFAVAWTITDSSRQMNLNVNADFDEQAMELGWPQVFPIHFWEGSCSVSGAIDCVQVSGKAYAELTHSWESGGPTLAKPNTGSNGPEIDSATDDDSRQTSEEFCLSLQGPNPFNPLTTIRYGLPRAGHVRIAVYNVLGQQVASLADGFRPAGSHSIIWNATNVPSGMYFVQMTAGAYSQAVKLMVLK